MEKNLRDLARALRPDSSFWRRTMVEGIRKGPDALVRYAPSVFGLAFGAALPEVRNRVRTNLRRIRGPRPYVEEMADVAAVFTNYAHSLAEAVLLGTERGHGIVAHARGVEHYEAAMAGGKGVIIATAHTGGWEAAGPMMSRVHPGEVVVVMARERDEEARALQDELRQRAGVRVVHIGETALDALPLLRHLKTNAVVAMQLDRVPPGMRAREVTLFGGPWLAPEGPLTIAALSGAPIMPVFTRRMGFLEYELVAHAPIRLPRRPTNEELDRAAQQMMDAMGAFLKAHPTQWFHFAS